MQQGAHLAQEPPRHVVLAHAVHVYAYDHDEDAACVDRVAVVAVETVVSALGHVAAVVARAVGVVGFAVGVVDFTVVERNE